MLRAGKLRVPFFLNSESQDVGVIHDYARMPGEVYLLESSDDYPGGSITKTFRAEGAEYTLDTLLVSSKQTTRTYRRDDYSAFGLLGSGQSSYGLYTDRVFSLVGTAQTAPV